MSHHEAVRKLAYKWQRIVWRMWQQRQPYDEARYLAALEKKAAKLAPVQNAQPKTV